MKRRLSSVSNSAVLVATVVKAPVVFSWLALTYFKPKLLQYWNPTPLKVLRVARNDSCNLHGEHGCAMAFEAPPAFHDRSLRGSVHLHPGYDARPYIFSVNRPELLRFPSKKTLRQIARGFEPYGLKVQQVHVAVGSGRSARTIIHELI